MTFTKNKLAAAMAGALIAGAGSQAAFAAVDVDNTANAGVRVANESIQATNSALAGGTDVFSIDGTMTANQIPSDTDIRVTVTLSSGTFGANPALSITDAAGATNSTGACLSGANTANTAACPAFSVFTGGGTADSTVTFNTNVGSDVIAAGAHFQFDLGAAGLVIGTSQSAITADIRIQIADNFGPTDLPGHTGEAYVSFGPVTALTADATTANSTIRIDVAADSLRFSGATNDFDINVGGWQIDETTTGELTLAGTAVAVDDIIGTAGGTITAANGFAAFNQGTSGGSITWAGGGANVACTVSTSDTTSAACQTYNPAATGDAASFNDITLAVPATNTVRIDETGLTATVAATGAATATFSTTNAVGTVSLLSLARNGSSARINFALTPGGSYPMFVRVTNPSSVEGPVTLTLTNDDGDTSSSINISAISGGPAGDLAAGASTGLLSIDDVMAAVQAADATFDLGATNKLRVDVVAEFGDSTNNTGVILGAFSVSSDGTTFNMMTDTSN